MLGAGLGEVKLWSMPQVIGSYNSCGHNDKFDALSAKPSQQVMNYGGCEIIVFCLHGRWHNRPAGMGPGHWCCDIAVHTPLPWRVSSPLCEFVTVGAVHAAGGVHLCLCLKRSHIEDSSLNLAVDLVEIRAENAGQKVVSYSALPS